MQYAYGDDVVVASTVSAVVVGAALVVDAAVVDGPAVVDDPAVVAVVVVGSCAPAGPANAKPIATNMPTEATIAARHPERTDVRVLPW